MRGVRLHCIEHKSAQDDIIKGIGQLFWYKFLMSGLYLWADRLFLYLLIDEDRVFEELKGFCKSFGFGLLWVNSDKLVKEVVTPENQHGLVVKIAQGNTRLKCSKCYKGFSPSEFKCPECEIELQAEASISRLADTFIRTSRQNYKGVPDYMLRKVEETPLLKKVFANWSKVQEAWKIADKED